MAYHTLTRVAYMLSRLRRSGSLPEIVVRLWPILRKVSEAVIAQKVESICWLQLPF